MRKLNDKLRSIKIWSMTDGNWSLNKKSSKPHEKQKGCVSPIKPPGHKHLYFIHVWPVTKEICDLNTIKAQGGTCLLLQDQSGAKLKQTKTKQKQNSVSLDVGKSNIIGLQMLSSS